MIVLNAFICLINNFMMGARYRNFYNKCVGLMLIEILIYNEY